MPLSQERRSQLDGIVLKMANQNAPKEDVQAIVNDFTSKYGNEVVAPTEKGIPGFAGAASGFVKEAASKPTKAAGLGLEIGEALAKTGLGKAIGETVIKPAAAALGVTPELASQVGQGLRTGVEQTKEQFRPVGTAEKVGAFGENVAEMALTGAMAAPNIAGKAAAAEKAVAPILGRLGSKAVGLGTKALGEGALAAGQTVAQTGELKDAGTAAALAAAIPVVGAGLKLASPILGKGARFAVGQATGLAPETVETALKTDLAKAGREVSRETLGERVGSAVEKRIEGLESVGKGYDVIRSRPETIAMRMDSGIHENVKKVLDKFGISLSDGKVVLTNKSRVRFSPSDKAALQDFLETYSKDPALTGETFLNTRSAADKMVKYDSNTTGDLQRVASSIRQSYDEMGKKMIKGLSELDAKYAPEVKFLKEVKKDLFNPDGSLKDNAYSKLANLTNAANFKRLQRMEKVVPGITQQVRILKALEDVERASGQKVGTYFRGAVAGSLAGGGLNPVTALVGAIVAQPENAVRILRAAGTISESTIAKILSGKMLTAFEKQNIASSLKSLAQQGVRSQQAQ